MNKIIRVLGRKGNTTIPFAIRMKTGFKPQDVISFEVKDRDTLIIHKEKICDRCNGIEIDDGILNVHFWNSSDEYYVENEDDFYNRMDNGMGGMM